MKFNYYGHSAFTLSDDVTTILFDPFITDNPWTNVCPTDIACQYIIVTHCHGDHYGDTEAIAKANDATVISTAEVAGKAGEAGCKAHAMHVGGSADFPFGKVRLTPAFHARASPEDWLAVSSSNSAANASTLPATQASSRT